MAERAQLVGEPLRDELGAPGREGHLRCCTPRSSWPCFELVDARAEPVDLGCELVHELQQRVVVAALVGEDGLDVPARQLADEELDRALDGAERAAAAADVAVGRDGPEPLGRAAGRDPGGAAAVGAAGSRPADLLLELCDRARRRRQMPCLQGVPAPADRTRVL